MYRYSFMKNKYLCKKPSVKNVIFCKINSKYSFQTLPWGKYRIEIYSESIRTIPIHSDIFIRANASHSERIRKTFCISLDEKR